MTRQECATEGSADPGDLRYRRTVWLLLLAALSLRVYIALHLPSDAPDDGRLYAQLAHNLVAHHVYARESAPPYLPEYFRMPGYPGFLAAVYAVFGLDANTAVRVMQAIIDTCTCGLAGVLAWLWAPAEWADSKRRRAALFALTLIAACPFVAVFVTTLLTEVPTTFTWMVAIVSTSLGLQTGRKRCWVLAGVACGAATLLRPDSGLLAAACGGMLLVDSVLRVRASGARTELRSLCRATGLRLFILSLAFCAMLGPWTARNAATFGVFMPIPPRHPNLRGETEELGYLSWLSTWVDDYRYVAPFEWELGSRPISVRELPAQAFDSSDEKRRVAELLHRYNHPAQAAVSAPVPAPCVRMTPDIDAGFQALAQQRIERHPLRHYLVVPLRRALGLWFDTHSDYYPFAGELQDWPSASWSARVWRTFFVGLIWAYTLGALCGLLATRRKAAPNLVLWFVALIALPRLFLLSRLENPEPRYLVEFFPWVLSLCALGLAARWPESVRRGLAAQARRALVTKPPRIRPETIA